MENTLRVYTLTFQFPRNYGAVLQAYALKTFLENEGCDVHIIDYWPPYAKRKFLWYSVFVNQPSLSNLLRIITRWKATVKFDKFRSRYLKLTKRCDSIEEIEALSPSDIIIVGSDQVWNPDLLGEYNDAYFLNFKTSAIRASFAASAGQDYFTDDELNIFANFAKNFEFLSVREESFRESLCEHGVSHVTSHLDPVFLLDQEEYRGMARYKEKKPYVLVYYLDSEGLTEKLALRIAKMKGGIPVYRIGKQRNRNGIKGIPYLSVEEFLGMIDQAECVVSCSFHACALSIILRKQFYAINASDRSSRLLSLLDRFNLMDRFVEDENAMEALQFKDIDYSKHESLMKQFITDAKSYLRMIICEARQKKSESVNGAI